jgi:hypothetical protein
MEPSHLVTEGGKESSENHGTAPEKRPGATRTFRPFAFYALLALASGALCYYLKGDQAFRQILWEGIDFPVMLTPRICGAVLLAGFVQALVPRDLVARWMGEESGFRGLLVATIAGIVTPGGPMTSFPLVVALYNSGAERGALIVYLTAWSLLGLQRVLVWELPLLGSDFVLVRYLACLVLPPLAGLIARRVPIRFERPLADRG